MAEIAVVHAPFGRGGSERVCLEVIEALEVDHDVTLVTDKHVDITEYNAYYGTHVDPSKISIRRPWGIDYLFETFAHRLWRFKQSIFNRYLDQIESEYDLVISTMDEYPLSGPSIQYIHYPTYIREGPDTPERSSVYYKIYDRICDRIIDPHADSLNNAQILANSAWTASVIRSGYNVSPTVVYPPVAVDRFTDVPWTDREEGFVSVGRYSPDKRLLELIDMVASLVDAGHDIHYHIVGPADNSTYAKRIRKKARQYDFIHVEGRLTTSEIESLLSTHRYGLHGKENEHFGIVVAEMVAAGMLPFVPANGGQTEILEPAPALMYDDWADAESAISRVLADPAAQQRYRQALNGTASRFSDERFEREIRREVAAVLKDSAAS